MRCAGLNLAAFLRSTTNQNRTRRMLQYMIAYAADHPPCKAAPRVRSHHDQFASKRPRRANDLVRWVATGDMPTDSVIGKVQSNRRQVSVDGFDRNRGLDRDRCKFTDVTSTRFPDMQEIDHSVTPLRFVDRQRNGRETGGAEIDGAKH